MLIRNYTSKELKKTGWGKKWEILKDGWTNYNNIGRFGMVFSFLIGVVIQLAFLHVIVFAIVYATMNFVDISFWNLYMWVVVGAFIINLIYKFIKNR